MVTYYADADQDGYGVTADFQLQCPASGIYTATVGGDCNDNNALVNPGVLEIVGNGIDDNCNDSVDENPTIALKVKLFIEGYYLGNEIMQPTLFKEFQTNDQSVCDSITVELHNSASPHMTAASLKTVVGINGIANVYFQTSFYNQSYYVVVKHRSSLNVWSKVPILFNASSKVFDFSR